MTPEPGKIIKYIQADIVFKELCSVDAKLKTRFENYLSEEYESPTDERLYYIDICIFSEYIVDKVKANQFDTCATFFEKVEEIFHSCDDYMENLMVVGLFESIQNIAGSEINYYTGFDRWLKPISKKNWDSVIDFWEGTNWRE